VEVEDFEQWDTLTLDAVPPGTIHGAPNSIAFHCRGDGKPRGFSLRVVERDGAPGFTPLLITRDWQAHIVHERAFAYAGGGANRGAADDHFSLTNLAAVTAGLSQEYGPQSPGAHQFALSDLRLVKDPRPPWQIVGWPAIPILGTPAAGSSSRAADRRPRKRRHFRRYQPLQGPSPAPAAWGRPWRAARLLPAGPPALDAHDQPVGAPHPCASRWPPAVPPRPCLGGSTPCAEATGTGRMLAHARSACERVFPFMPPAVRRSPGAG
jgi:hypothetical protein